MKNNTKIVFLLAAAISIGNLTACGTDNQENSATVSSETIVSTTEETITDQIAAKKHTQYPVTITNYASDGSEIQTTYEKAPEKVLAVYQGCIETMLALGLEDSMIAAAGLDNEVLDEWKEAFDKVEYLDEFTPSLETATMLEPDMIFSWGSLFKEKTLGDVSGWQDKGTNIYISSNTRTKTGDVSHPRTLEKEYQDLLNIGIIFDKQDQAEAIVNDMRNTVEQVIEETSAISEKPTVLILESYGDVFRNYGANSLGGDMVTSLGAKLASEDGRELGKEDIIALNPDVIFIVYMPYSGENPDTVRDSKLDIILKDEVYTSLNAVKNGKVVPIMLSEMFASAIRTKDGIVTFANGLYPDLKIQ